MCVEHPKKERPDPIKTNTEQIENRQNKLGSQWGEK